MPRLSLYKPERGNDYKFMDNRIYEMFTIGGTDVNIHKYVGTDDGDVVKDNTQIQDILFLENRDRKYDSDIYTIRGIYNVQDIDFDLSQFGLFLTNDTLFMTIHITTSVKALGRKIMSGDVIELPHLKDEHAENDFATSLKRYYVVEDVNRAAEGFSPTWFPHLYRVKLKQIVDSQEFADILETPEDEDIFMGDYAIASTYEIGQVVKYKGKLYEATSQTQGNTPTDVLNWAAYSDNTLRDLLSTYENEKAINDAVLTEAEADAPKSGYDIGHYYTLDTDDSGKAVVSTVADPTASSPGRTGYAGYLIEAGQPPNGAAFGSGTSFPAINEAGDYFLRTDFLPNRLFQYDGSRWIKMQDNVRMTMTNTNDRKTQIGTFINNTNTDVIGDETVSERQALSKALRPKADDV
ncbi:MAG: hypothetical protein ACKVJK_01280 [Methylophagaceae bacterium]|jgi:hypothetical protein|tara:strand:+ start:9880 stop:11103 length:1224 start_codon:yes stop_codon:yes gene_type:complete